MTAFTVTLHAMRHLQFLVVLALASPAWASNYAECILDRAPKAQNDVAAGAIHEVCLSENPGGLPAVGQGSGRGVFSHKSGAACVAAVSRDTRSVRAAQLISASCRRLYDESEIDRFLGGQSKP